MKSDEITKTATSDFASSIQGRIAGVSVRQGNSAPVKMHKLQLGITFQEGAQDHCMLLMVLHILRIQILLPKKNQ